MKLRKNYPTRVLSDIHLGSEHSRTEEVTNFLKHVNCGRLILNGDIIDGCNSGNQVAAGNNNIPISLKS